MQTFIDEHRKNFDPDNIDDYIDAFIYEQKFNKKKENEFVVTTVDTYWCHCMNVVCFGLFCGLFAFYI